MKKIYIGLDIAKLSFVAAIKMDNQDKVKSFTNDTEGFQKLIAWTQKLPGDQCHYCMESTGKYGDALALFLYNATHTVSIVNPAKIKHFMQSQLSRNKTDSVDSKFIRYYTELFSPAAWSPLPSETQELQALVKRRDSLKNMLLQEGNRLENVEVIIKKSIDDHIDYLKKEIKATEEKIEQHINNYAALKKNAELLKSIPGIGEVTTSKALAFFGNVTQFDNAKQVAAFIGLNPQHAQSGTSLNYCHISKTGDAELRKMFYMPALVAIQRDPDIRAFYEKLLAKGKAKKVGICAVMRRLVHIIYGVLKSQKPFNSVLIRVH